MYSDPFYNTGAQYPPMWLQMPPGFTPMPAPGPYNYPGDNANSFPQQGFPGQNSQGFGFPPADNYSFPGYSPPPPPDFSGFYQQ